jgi:phage gp29-like protein
MPRKKLPTELKQEIASVERDINYTVYGGVLQNPDETLLKRGSGKGLKLYDEIEEDSHAYAVLQKRKLAVISRPWEVKAGGTSKKDKMAAELVKEQLEKKLDQLTCDLLDATLKGFAVSEIMWEDLGDEIDVKFLARDQRRFTFAPDNSLRLLTLQNMVTGEPVPARKFIRHSFGAKDGNPFGRGLGSKLYFPVWFKRQGISFWLIFCEKFGMPTAVGKYPNGSTQAEINKLKAALQSVAQDAGVVIPEGMLIELLEASRSSTSDLYERIVRYMDEQMSECVLGETLTTNIGSVGSKAAADTHNGVRLEISKADADLLSATINETYCVWVTKLNVPGANPPTLWRIFEEQEDLDKRADRDKTLFDMGYRLTPKKVEEVYGEGYELIEDAQQAGAVSDDEFLKNSSASADSNTTDQESDQSPPDNQDAGNQDNRADTPTGFTEDEPQGISDEEFINNSLYHEDSALFTELQEVFKQDAKSLFAEFSEDAEGDLIQQVLDWAESLEKLPYDLYENLTEEFTINNLDVATLTLIGKRVCQLVADIKFAESKIRVTDSGDLLEMKSIIESTYLDGITAIPEAYYNSDNGEFVGIFEDKLSPQVTKRYKFSFTTKDIAYKLINPGDLVNFSEESLNYAAKGKNCTKGTQCGASCISATKQCRKNLPPGAKDTAVKLEKKLKENNKSASKTTQPKTEIKSKTNNSDKVTPVKTTKQDFPDTLDNLELVKTLDDRPGSVLMRDPATGKLYVRKEGSSEDIRNESAADAAYAALGVNVPKHKVYETSSGLVKLSEYVEGRSLKDIINNGTDSERKQVISELQKNFVADTLLGNIGLAQNNIIVDKDGQIWRIDNSSALNKFNEYPTELWSMRNADVNSEASKLFSGLKHSDIVNQIDGISSKQKELISSLPKEYRETLKRRIEEMERVATISKTLANDNWKDDYISNFTKHTVGIRSVGITDKLPKSFTQKSNNDNDDNYVTLLDGKGKEFDNLRGANSTMIEVENYINKNGGDYNTIITWMEKQAGDNWKDNPQALKYYLSQQREKDSNSFYWQQGYDTAKSNYQKIVNEVGEKVYSESFSAFHAFNYELLSKVDLPNKNSDGTITVLRTESKNVMERYGLKEGDDNVKMKRSYIDSTSLVKPIVVSGAELTEQKVPIHRIIGTYMYERNPGKGDNSFFGDNENEIVAMLDDIPFKYTRKLNAMEDSELLSAFFD